MPTYEYKLGLTLGTLVNVEELVPGLENDSCVPPRGLAVTYYPIKRIAANGIEVGDGFPTTAWEWDIMYQAQFDALMEPLNGAQSAPVYIHTRVDDRTYKYYHCVMHRPSIPEEAQPSMFNVWLDVKIRFTMLEEVGVY